jgi:hypothetical protein
VQVVKWLNTNLLEREHITTFLSLFYLLYIYFSCSTRWLELMAGRTHLVIPLFCSAILWNKLTIKHKYINLNPLLNSQYTLINKLLINIFSLIILCYLISRPYIIPGLIITTEASCLISLSCTGMKRFISFS